MTVPYRAVLKGRKGKGVELNTAYFMDGRAYLSSAEMDAAMPSLFDDLEDPCAISRFFYRWDLVV
ncbi:hypothetical protein CCP4SC76_7640019 [Gammaproteobacteria bacterium]